MAGLETGRNQRTLIRRYASLCLITLCCLGYVGFGYFSQTLQNPDLGAARGTPIQVNERLLRSVFDDWSEEWGNGSEKFIASKLIAQGTVRSSFYALDTDKNHRSQALLGCFDYDYTFVNVFTTGEMCILSVKHGESGEMWQLGRGSRYIEVLWKHLKRGDFQSNVDIS